MIGVGISTWRAGVLGGDSGVALGVGGTTLTALAQILALDPVALWWPSEGSGWQGRTGGTLSAVGSPVGILPDLSELGGATLDEWLANPTTPELVTNGGFDTDSDWTKGTGWTISGGVASYDGTDATNAIFQLTTILTLGVIYFVSITVSMTQGALLVRPTIGATAGQHQINASGTYGLVLTGGGGVFGCVAGNSGGRFIGTIDNISVRELPGIHAIAPSDAARPLLQAGLSIDFDGIDDQLKAALANGTYYLATVATNGTVSYSSTVLSGGTGLVIDTDMTALIVRGTDFTAQEQATIEGVFA